MTTGDLQHGISTAFWEKFVSTFGRAEAEALSQAMSQPSPTSIRLNPFKIKSLPLSSSPIRWCDLGHYLGTRPIFGIDPLWHSGAYYVQEASSMILAQYLPLLDSPPKIALDLCAAPGGKTTLLRSLLPMSCLLVANEPDKGRASILNENIARFGNDEIIVTNSYPDLLRKAGMTCDLILVDAPCSGEGMFRKDPKTRSEWSLGSVSSCSQRQRDILDEAWRMLHPGGTLIYSTCTYNKDENEDQLTYLLEHYDVSRVLSLDLQSPTLAGVQKGLIEGVYRLFPHHLEGEGLAIFAVQKAGLSPSISPSAKKQKTRETKALSLPGLLKDALPSPQCIYLEGNEYIYLSSEGQQIRHALSKSKVPILSGGTILGEMKGKDFIPHHSWSMSHQLACHAPYPRIEVDSDTALAYLRRESISTTVGYRGFECITYRGIPLGWVKNIGNRTNNLYPKDLMIRNQSVSSQDLLSLF